MTASRAKSSSELSSLRDMFIYDATDRTFLLQLLYPLLQALADLPENRRHAWHSSWLWSAARIDDDRPRLDGGPVSL